MRLVGEAQSEIEAVARRVNLESLVIGFENDIGIKLVIEANAGDRFGWVRAEGKRRGLSYVSARGIVTFVTDEGRQRALARFPKAIGRLCVPAEELAGNGRGVVAKGLVVVFRAGNRSSGVERRYIPAARHPARMRIPEQDAIASDCEDRRRRIALPSLPRTPREQAGADDQSDNGKWC